MFDDPDRLTDLDTDRVTFRAGATVRLHDALSVYAHFAEGFRAPPPAEVNLFLDIPLFNVRALPNPDLEPERSDTVEAGFRLRHSGTLLDMAGYYTRYDDFIESRANLGLDPVSGILLFQSRNIEEAHIYGAEASMTQHLGALHPRLDAFALDAGFHWARGENDVTNEPLNDVTPLKATFALRWTPRALPLLGAFRVTHLARQDRVDFSEAAFFVPPAATVLDVTLRWTPRPERRGTARYLQSHGRALLALRGRAALRPRRPARGDCEPPRHARAAHARVSLLTCPGGLDRGQ